MDRIAEEFETAMPEIAAWFAEHPPGRAGAG